MKFGRMVTFCFKNTGMPLKSALFGLVFSQSVVAVANVSQSPSTQTKSKQTKSTQTKVSKAVSQNAKVHTVKSHAEKNQKAKSYTPQSIEEVIYTSGGYTSYNSIKRMENASGIGGEDIENLLPESELPSKQTKSNTAKSTAALNKVTNISADKLKPVEISIDPLEKTDVLGDLANVLTQNNTQETNNKSKKNTNIKKITNKDLERNASKQSLPADDLKNNHTATTKAATQAEEKPDSITLLTNETLAKRYGNSFAASSKIVAHPIRNAKRTSKFGYRRIFGRKQFHKGVDFAAPYGTAIYAAGAGTVSYSGWMRGYGRIVIIDHGEGLKTRYAHNSKLRVKKGQRVQASQHISDMGCSGRCTGPHLHFEVRKNGKAQNPAKYLKGL